jgi:hypothetical protein
MRVGPRCDAACANIVTCTGQQLPWVNEMRYLGVNIVKSRRFKCILHEHKKSFFRSVNAIFGKVGSVAAEEVIVQLIFSKCIPVLLYGLEAITLTKTDMSSLDFTFNRFMMKLFKTTDMHVIRYCQDCLGVQQPSTLLVKRRAKFLGIVDNSEGHLFSRF